MKKIIILIFLSLFLYSCWTSNQWYNYDYSEPTYNEGYEYAQDNAIDTIEGCELELWGIDSIAGCTEYVENNYLDGQDLYFGDYVCTDDCSWHEAWYDWAEENGIDDEYNCDGKSNSFNEWCLEYVNEYY